MTLIEKKKPNSKIKMPYVNTEPCRNFSRYKGIYPPKCGCMHCEDVYQQVQRKRDEDLIKLVDECDIVFRIS
jgi:hypothetical protein